MCFLRCYLLAYAPHKDIQCHVLDDATCFSHVKHTCKSISYLSKCDFSTDYNGNYNKDTKPLWCDFIPSLTVKYNPTESFWGLQKLNGKFHYVNFIKLGTPISKIYLVHCCAGKNIIWIFFIANDSFKMQLRHNNNNSPFCTCFFLLV